jgi:hypothetical protein
MAGVAEVLLLIGEQVFGGSRLMNGVAVRTDDVGLGMATALDVVAGEIFRVTLETVVERLGGGELGEGDDGRFLAAAGDVRSSGAVTALAAPIGLGVSVTEEVLRLHRVAGATSL